MNTIIAAAFGAMTAMVLNSLILTLAGDSSKWSLLTTVNGSLAGGFIVNVAKTKNLTNMF